VLDLPASEIEYWREFYSIFPFPQDRQEIQTALLATVIANTSGNVKKAKKIEDFLPDYFKTKTKNNLSKEDFKRQIQMFTRKEGK